MQFYCHSTSETANSLVVRLIFEWHRAKIRLEKQKEEQVMFNIDKQEFGTFVAMLRKEKGITQKELAERLFISDKAVSKWETAISVPNIDLLIPLANILGVTVTELLMCQHMEQDNVLSTTQVEQVVKTAISYSDEEQTRTYQAKGKWGIIYVFSLIIACFEMLFAYMNEAITDGLITVMILGVIFGAYFCFFVKEKLPTYYDENRVYLYADGVFRMNLPGLSLNNSNWGKILKVGRIWSIAIMLAYPIISYIETLFITGIWKTTVDLFLALLLTLGGLFIPTYLVGKKYR